MSYKPEESVARMRLEIAELEMSLEEGSWCRVPTTRGLHAIVDPDLSTRIRSYRWWAKPTAGGNIYPEANVENRRVSLPRLVLKLLHPHIPIENIKHVSFENKCTFDCRSSNLKHRFGRRAVMRNRRAKSNSSSRYKGVRKRNRTNGPDKYSATISFDDLHVGLGTFDSEIEAARVYDAAARILFDGAGHLNLSENEVTDADLQLAATRIRICKDRLSRKNIAE